MTISVSKAWASNITVYSGERAFLSRSKGVCLHILNYLLETPPGEESRLTRALKAYHIDKARDPTDLPPWLFEEHERRPRGGPGTSLRDREGSEDDYDSHRATAPPRSGGRGLRDIYDAAEATATATAIPPRETRGRLQNDVSVAPAPSKANDRLKALRDAKRNAALRNAPGAGIQSSHPNGEESEERGRGYGSDRGDSERYRSPSLPGNVRPRGGGLPSGRSIRKF